MGRAALELAVLQDCSVEDRRSFFVVCPASTIPIQSLSFFKTFFARLSFTSLCRGTG